MSLITGIDEAGRGAILGPLVIAGVTIRKEDEDKLKSIGCKDSKLLSPNKREELAKKIEKIATNVIVLRIQPCTIDDYRASGTNLDKIEAMKMAQIISMGEAMNDGGNTIFIDALSQNPKRFHQIVRSYLKNKDADLVVKNYLDESVVVVSAASIIAKVERDNAIKEIKKRVGVDFGVGYTHDKRTIDFIEGLIKKKRDLPTYVRRSWVTTQFLIDKNWQRKLKDFFVRKEDCREGAA